MSRYPGVAALLEGATARALEQKSADAIGRKAQAVRRAGLKAQNAESRANDVDSRVPKDDGIAPLAPSNFTATPTLGRQLDFTWSEPVPSDHVTHSIIEITPQSESVRQIRGTALFAYAMDLTPKAHVVRARFVDRWGRLGTWSATRTVTPKKTVAEYIDAAEAEIAGEFGWENLEPLNDPANLGDDVVTARAMAAQGVAAMRLWVNEAAIDSAMIRDLSVDKLTAGTFTAGQITLSGGGKLKAGGTTLDADGIKAGGTTLDADGIKAGGTLLSADGLTIPRLNATTGEMVASSNVISSRDGRGVMGFNLSEGDARTTIQAVRGQSPTGSVLMIAKRNASDNLVVNENAFLHIRTREENGDSAVVVAYPRVGFVNVAEGGGGNYNTLENSGGTLTWKGAGMKTDNMRIDGQIEIERMFFRHANGQLKRVYYDGNNGNLYINP